MNRINIKVLGYFFLRYIFFYVVLLLTSENVKGINIQDLKTGKDWFMLTWLFLVPLLIEIVVLIYPFSYGLNKVSKGQNKYMYVVFLGAFLMEYVIYNWMIGLSYPFLKIGVSIVLFILLFRKLLV